jgi:hypothetical protein
MDKIPLNLLSLYADLMQRHQSLAVQPASISRKRIRNRLYLYAAVKAGASRRQAYLGPAGNKDAEDAAAAHEQAARVRAELKRSVQALKRAGIRGPTIMAGRVIESLAHAGVFERGGVLVGTVAYQQYPCLAGAYLTGAAAQTEDADLAAARIALPKIFHGIDLLETLRQADPSFAPVFAGSRKAPRRLVSASGFMVEVLTTLGRRDEDFTVPGLGIAAIPLPYLDYLIEEPVTALALYGAGILVRVPDPARYAIHKLIVHQLREPGPKRIKDLLQARELITALHEHDPDALDDAIAAAKARGRSSARLVRSGLSLLKVGKS